MQLPDEAPKLPKLPFLIGDGLLLATAAVLVQRSDAPLSASTTIAVVACVAIGAVLAVIPFLADYARRQDAALTERQNSLEALARTTAAAAEQISIAASGLHTIAEQVHRNLKLTEQLPHRLQEKINEFSQQRDEAIVAENEALTQEVNSLRASEAEKLETAASRIHRTVADLAKFEQSIQGQAQALRETLEKLPDAAQRAAEKAGRAVAVAGDETAAKVRGEIDSSLALALGSFTARLTSPVVTPATAVPHSRAKPKAAPTEAPAPVAEPLTVAPAAAPPAAPAEPPPAAEPAVSTPADPAPAEAPATVEPAPATDTDPTPPPAPPRKRPRKAADADQGTLLDLSEIETSMPPSSVTDRSLSNDGLTRVVVTAYIGIGNRLFVRGDGPGLSWDKGVPLQFVSIGKWRWETPDATAPVTIKIFKNDQVECPALGAVTIEPGQQAEVSANF